MAVAIPSVPREDAAVLHAAAQRGRLYIAWPDDARWVGAAAAQVGDRLDPKARLRGMTSRGSLASVARERWVVMPPGASTLEQAAPVEVLLAAKFNGRADWYLGYLSALARHRLTDIDPEALYIGVRGATFPSPQRLGTRVVHVVHITRDDDWSGVSRERHGRIFSYLSDIERTLLDTLDQPRRCGPPEVWVRAWERAMREERADVAKLAAYAEGRSDTTQARLSFWLRETGHVRPARHVMRLVGGPLRGRRLLDSSQSFGDGSWRHDRETGLLVNMPQRAIDGWLGYGK
jgi:predicted transcriptional regulator of viral defense system